MIYSPDFLGGLITGEGCFCLSVNRLKQSKTDWLRVTPAFSMTMTDLRVMENVGKSFHHYGLPVYMQDRTAANSRRERRPALAIHISGIKRTHRVADFFIPYLSGNKKDAATVIRDFCEHRLTRRSRGLDDTDIALIEKLREVNGTNGVKNYSVSDLRDYKLGLLKAA